MVRKLSIASYVIGFLLIIVAYSTVNGGLHNYDMSVEVLLEISHVFFIPVIIGFILIWPLFRNKSSEMIINIFRYSVGLIILGINLVSLVSLLDEAFSFISEYNRSILGLYLGNPDFAARIFLISVRIAVAGLLIAPFRIPQEKVSDFMGGSNRNSISNDMKSIIQDLKKEFNQNSIDVLKYFDEQERGKKAQKEDERKIDD